MSASGPSGPLVLSSFLGSINVLYCHLSVILPLTKTNLQRLQRNDRAMIRQICSIKPEEVAMVHCVGSSELLAKLELEDLDLILRERRLRWFGHAGFYRT